MISNIKRGDTGMIFRRDSELEYLLKILIHDIANPLTSIKLHSEILLEEALEKDRVRLKQILKKVRNITEQLDQIKRMRTLEDGKLPMKKVRLNIDDVIEELIDLFDANVMEKSLKIKVKRLDSRKRIFADPYILKNQIFANILSNAIKSSRAGGEIFIATQEVKDFILVDFIDHGEGVDPQVLAHLFDINYQTSRKGTGTGYGMILVKKFIELQGGQIEVITKHLKGTTMRISLPIAGEIRGEVESLSGKGK